MKKYFKIIAIALAFFLAGITSSSAKEMSIEELGREVERLSPNAGYVYIIGNYAFTSTHIITQNDIMLASSSLRPVDPKDPNQMVIYNVVAKKDPHTFQKIGWIEGEPALGKGKLPNKVDIRYIDYNHIGAASNSKLSVNVNDNKYVTYKNVLKEALHFETTNFYGTDLKYEGNKLTGLLLKKNVDDISYNDADKLEFAGAKYFFAFVLEVENATKDTLITRTGLDGETEQVKLSDFDVKIDDEENTPGIVTLIAIDPTKWQTSNKKITVSVDLDGNGDYYDPTDYVIDASGLTFQTDSSEKATISEDNKNIITNQDKETLTSWGYNSGINNNVVFKTDTDNPLTVKASGKLIEQTVNKDVFGASKETGYYFDFTFVLEGNQDKKAVVSLLKDNNIDNISKTYVTNEYDENGNLTILYRIDPSKNCADGSCKAYFKVDLDGEGKEYLPVMYTIDYSGLTLEKASLFSVQDITEIDKAKFENSGWYDTDNGYSIAINRDENEAKLFKATGLLPLLADNTQWNKDNAFDSNNYYYMGLALKLDNSPAEYNANDMVLTLEEGIPFIKKYDTETKTVFLLVGLNPAREGEKTFTITMDLDGADKEDYAAYNVTVDYSGVVFQTESVAAVKAEKLDVASLEESPEKTELESYKFNSNTINELVVSDSEISGKIKEQTLDKDASGFEDNNGYFVPIKLSIPVEEAYKDKWTITLYDEKGTEKVYEPKDYERNQGWLLVLFKIDSEKTELKYKVDFDGSGKNFLPKEYTIKVNISEDNYLTENKITFKYFDETLGKENSKDVIVYQGENVSQDMIPDFSSYAYHTLDGWYDDSKEVSEKVDLATKTTGKDEDLVLTAHFTINADNFVNEVMQNLNENTEYNELYTIEITEDNNIKLKVLNSTTKLEDLTENVIAETIAYILQGGEVKDVTLSANNQKVVFTKGGANNVVQPVSLSLDEEGLKLKDSIKTGANTLFTTAFGEGKTLNELGVHNNSFKIAIGSVADSVKLADEVNKEYTISFETEVAQVKSENDLEAALRNEKITHIDITGDFDVTKVHNITRNLVINGNPDASDGKHVITAKGETDVNTIFNVQSPNVTIENVTLKDAKQEAIIVTSGLLTTKGVEIVYTDDTLPETVVAGIEVSDNASLIASDMVFSKEHYNKPLVRAGKNGTSVELTDVTNKLALKVVKENINRVSNDNDTKSVDSEYTFDNYHNDPRNSKIYTTKLMTHEGGVRLYYTKYNYYNEAVQGISEVERFNTFVYEGKTYSIYGYSLTSNNILYSTEDVKDNKVPEGVIKKDELKATSDQGYWVVYTVTPVTTAEEVTTKDRLVELLSKTYDGDVNTIYIPSGQTIEIDGELKIERDVAIYGKGGTINNGTIKATKIVIDKDVQDADINRINLIINASAEEQDSLIEVNGKKFTLWQASLTNIGKDVAYGIKYTNDEAVVDIRYMGVGGSKGFVSDHITDAYIYISGNVTNGSDLYLNSFPKGSEELIPIIINGFKNATKEDDIYGIRFFSNTVDKSMKYAMKLTQNVSGQSADIKFGQGKIAIEYADDKNDFDNIGLYANVNDVNIVYIKEGQTEENELPGDGQKVTFKAEIVTGVPEASISGLSQNADGTYSGTIAQSEDGKFYLPVEITSSKFVDRESMIKVTDPNNESHVYLYSMYAKDGIVPITLPLVKTIIPLGLDEESNVGIMKIDLEAIKTAKISGDKGKVYTIEYDYAGDGNYEESSTINYSDVQTEEEIILEAAKNTQNADSFTVVKNNNIKSAKEDFTFKNNLKNGNKHYTDGNAEQYTFSEREVGLDLNSYVVVEKSENINKPIVGKTNLEARPQLNGWTYLSIFTKVSSGTQELTLLTDIINEGKIVDAIATVTPKADTPHTYIVEISHERLEKWLNGMYIDGKALEKEQRATHNAEENATITLEVTLDETDKFVTAIKTTQEFIINSNNIKYEHNTIDVKFKDINQTIVETPNQIFGSVDAPASNETIQAFIQTGKDWWHKYTGSTSAS